MPVYLAYYKPERRPFDRLIFATVEHFAPDAEAFAAALRDAGEQGLAVTVLKTARHDGDSRIVLSRTAARIVATDFNEVKVNAKRLIEAPEPEKFERKYARV